MMIGHLAVGLAAKRWAPRASLGALLLSSVFGSLLWATLVLVGVEEVVSAPGLSGVMPYDFRDLAISHSLVSAVIWGVLAGIAYRAFVGGGRAAWVVGVVVAVHWFGDFIVHRPDLPLHPGGDLLVGAGVYASVGGTLAVELGLFAVGLALYLRSTRPVDRAGAWGVGLLAAAMVGSFLALVFVRMPPGVSGRAFAQLTQVEWLLVLLGGWVDGHRRPMARQDFDAARGFTAAVDG